MTKNRWRIYWRRIWQACGCFYLILWSFGAITVKSSSFLTSSSRAPLPPFHCTCQLLLSVPLTKRSILVIDTLNDNWILLVLYNIYVHSIFLHRVNTLYVNRIAIAIIGIKCLNLNLNFDWNRQANKTILRNLDSHPHHHHHRHHQWARVSPSPHTLRPLCEEPPLIRRGVGGDPTRDARTRFREAAQSVSFYGLRRDQYSEAAAECSFDEPRALDTTRELLYLHWILL